MEKKSSHEERVLESLEEIVRLLKEQNSVSTTPYTPYLPSYQVNPFQQSNRYCPHCGVNLTNLLGVHNCQIGNTGVWCSVG